MATFRKILSKPGLISLIRDRFGRIENPVIGRRYGVCDYLMSGFAMFVLKEPSLLQFDKDVREDTSVEENLKTLFEIDQVPCDSAMRKNLDLVDPESLHDVFNSVHRELQRGKILEEYKYFRDHLLISIDGTKWFESKKVHCKNCCVKKHGNGQKSYYHQMLAAVIIHHDHKSVFPMSPEMVQKKDESEKNDCELNAARRKIERIRREHPHMKLVTTLDALYSNGPFIRFLESRDMRYIITVKDSSHEFLLEQLKTNDNVEHFEMTDEENTNHRFRYLKKVSLNRSNPEIKVNAIEYRETKPNSKPSRFCWITDMELEEGKLMEIMRAGRARWKIENETFNTLKNQGYHFEHNYGHGDLYLSTVFAMLMLLAFLVDQIEQKCCKVFHEALKKERRLKYLRSKTRLIFDAFIVPDWETLYSSIVHGFEKVAIEINDTS